MTVYHTRLGGSVFTKKIKSSFDVHSFTLNPTLKINNSDMHVIYTVNERTSPKNPM